MIFHNDWDKLLAEEMNLPYYQDLRRLLAEEYKTQVIYPKQEEVMAALRLTSFQETRVVILGQDPYHGAGQAEGLAFSVKKNVPLPPSLRNIYRELQEDVGCDTTQFTGSLIPWAKQGVLLLNTTLTVRQGQAASHSKIGWEFFTDAILHLLNEKTEPVVFILWGAHARSKKRFLNNPNHLVVESAHPSPLSAYRGFFGSKPFSRTNEFLISKGESPVDWCAIERREDVS